MRRWRPNALMLATGLLVLPATALGNPRDIQLRGLGRPDSSSFQDPAVQRYRRLTSELALALAPRPLAPAETLGMSGFEFALVTTTADIDDSADYWQGQPGQPIFEGVLPSHGSRDVPGALWVPTLHVRKGLPMSTEIGVTGAYLAFSEMFMVGGDVKIAVHESYFRWVPALALRAAAGRLFGSSDIDMITTEFDTLASLPFGVGGMVQVTPYIGYGIMYAHVNSQVLDETPEEVLSATDQKGGADGSLYTFPTIDMFGNDFGANQHGRFYLGVRVGVAMLELLYELNVGFTHETLVSHSIKLGFDV